MKRRRFQQSLENEAMAESSNRADPQRGVDLATNPSPEANHDAAPTRYPPENEGKPVREKSRYVASEPYRSKKGDRLS